MEKKLSLSASALKHIALISMLIDHFAAIYLETKLMNQGIYPYDNQLYVLLRNIGRIAFPIYCFQIAEGAKHTRDIKKYALRLLIFALASSIPYNITFFGSAFTLEGQNVYYTLFAGLLCIWLYQYCKENNKSVLFIIGFFVICELCIIFETDYSLFGPILIMFFYLYKEPYQLFTIGIPVFIIGCYIMYYFIYIRYYAVSYNLDFALQMLKPTIIDTWYALELEIWGLAAFVFIYLYDGSKGKSLPKMFYYLFYPEHIIILYLITKYTL